MTATACPEWARTLLDVLDRQHALYEQLVQLGVSQQALVADGQTDALLNLLSQRQTVVDQLVQLNGELDPIRAQWSELWSQLAEPHREKVRARMADVQGLLDGIIEQDERDRQALVRQRQDVAGQLGRVQQGAAVNRAYGQSSFAPATNRFTDQTG